MASRDADAEGRTRCPWWQRPQPHRPRPVHRVGGPGAARRHRSTAVATAPTLGGVTSPNAEYPETRRTWLAEQLQGSAAAREAAQRDLMALYAEPLRRTAQRRFRLTTEDALDLVHGFFASRWSRPDYFQQWQQSGMRLRNWLWHGLDFYRREQARRERRLPVASVVPDVVDPSAADPGVELERNFAIALVQAAMRRAEAECHAAGFGQHWAVFAARAAGQPLPTIAAREGLTVNQAQVRLRAPQRRFVAALGDLLVADGVPGHEVPRAIAELVATAPTA